MEERKAFKLQVEDLRRIWHWVMNSHPKDSWEFQALRAASTEIGEILKPVLAPDGRPGLPAQLPISGEVEIKFSGLALSGIRRALLQSILGENHPEREPAPFAAIEFMILPIARTLGLMEQMSHESGILAGME